MAGTGTENIFNNLRPDGSLAFLTGTFNDSLYPLAQAGRRRIGTLTRGLETRGDRRRVLEAEDHRYPELL